MLANRRYTIEDDGDEVHLSMFQDDQQVGGALFPDDGAGGAFDLAYQVGELFAASPGGNVLDCIMRHMPR